MFATEGYLQVALVVEADAPTFLVELEVVSPLRCPMVLEIEMVKICCRAVIDGLRGVASAPAVVAGLGDDEV